MGKKSEKEAGGELEGWGEEEKEWLTVKPRKYPFVGCLSLK